MTDEIKHVQALAKAALTATLRGDDEEAARILNDEINWGDGGQSLASATCYFADATLWAYRKTLGIEIPPGADVSVDLKFWDADTGTVRGAEGVPSDAAWAGRFVAARAADDDDQQNALLRAVYELDGEGFADYINALFSISVTHLRVMRGEPL